MDRRIFIAALCAAPLVSFGKVANAQNAVVDAVNAYLTGLQSATARFTQESSDGSVVNGTFYMAKPGKMRFEYDPPSPALIIADGETLAIYDRKSTRGPQRYAQSSTPMSLLSRSDIDVTQSRYVRLIEVEDGQVHVTMYDPEKPDNGTMRMIFDQDPMVLRSWVIVEGNGLESVVNLGPLSTGMSFDRKLFDIVYNNGLLRSGDL